ncbi:MAG: peptidylprolyl isomerase [Oscillospiraceae bacterium]|nr:peptidylprolyl isomerase [Oscillospiraceae bacterium]
MKYTKLAAAALSCTLLLGGCGANTGSDSSETLMTVGDINVTENEFNFFLTTYKDNMDLGAAKELSLEYCERNHLIIAVAEAMGIEFDEETQTEIDEYKQQVVDAYDSDTGYNEFLKENGLTDEYIDRLVSVGFYSDALQEVVENVGYTDEEKREYFKEHYRRAKHILLTSEEEDATIEAQAEELLERAQSGEDFDTLISEYSEDPGSETYPDGYVFTDDEMVVEFQDGVDSIGIGEFTLVKSSYGYHIIQRLALDETEEYFEEQYANVESDIESAMENDKFLEQLYAWAEEYGIEITVNQELLDSIE